MVERRNLTEQTLVVKVRYQLLREGQVVEEQVCLAPERWYFKHEMVLMLERVGFRDIRVTGNYTNADVTDEHYVMVFIGTK
jgi:hypothetical protein